MTKITKTLIAAVALVLTPSIAPSIAFAASDDGREPTMIAVRIGDLNLGSASGKATFKARIASAVSRVCGVSGGTTDLNERQAVMQCRAKARHDALAAAHVGEAEVLATR